MDKLYVTVKEQFPQFVQTEYPAFIAFVQAYYKWLEEEYSIDKIENVVDIDKTATQFVENFKMQLDVYGLYSDAQPFDIKYIKTIREVYESKGSEQALVFLIKSIYNGSNDTKILYPRDSVLRVSDGVWEQERFITVTKSFGVLPTQINTLIIEHEGGEEFLTITRVDIINADTTRFYYKTNIRVSLDIGSIVKIVSNSGTLYRGSITLSPNSIKIVDGGADWQLGQVIKFPGSIKDTICRVTKIDDNGTIERLEVVEYGFNHIPDQTIIISPYPIKPAVTTYDYEFDVITNTHLISIFDYLDGTSENVNGVSADTSPNSYFLENYVLGDYAARTVIQTSNQSIAPTILANTSSPITIEQWASSRARLQYVFNKVTATRGRWVNSRGIISDSFIRLQDNNYYQQYSYVIESNALLSQYRPLLSSMHVAGTKAFATYATSEFLNIAVEVLTEIPFKFVTVFDEVDTSDLAIKDVIMPVVDSSSVTDSDNITFTKSLTEQPVVVVDILAAKQFIGVKQDNVIPAENVDFIATKILLDTPTPSDDLNIDLTRNNVDQVTTTDSDVNNVNKSLLEEVLPVDSIDSVIVSKQLEDLITSADSLAKLFDKDLDDNAQAYQLDVSSDYNTEVYFAQDYAELADPTSFEAILS